MNIFFLDYDIEHCVQMHCNKHVVKMMTEYAQLLSTAHRVLDGDPMRVLSDSGRRTTRWVLADVRDAHVHQATHANHPSAVWCRYSKKNYEYLHTLMAALCKEYTYRYGKTYKAEQTGLLEMLSTAPKNISDREWTEPTPAMPTQYIIPGNSVESYRAYYRGDKRHIAAWSKRQTPEWFY